MIFLFQFAAIVLYVIACLLKNQRTAQQSLAWLACALHIISSTAKLGGLDDFALNAAHAVNFSTAILVLGFLISSLSKDIIVLGIALYPFAALCNLIAIFSPLPAGQAISSGLMVHILLSVIAFSIIALGALEAGLIQILRYRLKNHKMSGRMSMFPPLQTLDTLLFQTILCGTLVLSAAILTGAYFVDQFFSPELIPKTALTLMAWLLFSVVLAGRTKLGWGGQVVSRITLTGYFLLLLGFIGVKLLFS